jgi:hypothetical protein
LNLLVGSPLALADERLVFVPLIFPKTPQSRLTRMRQIYHDFIVV